MMIGNLSMNNVSMLESHVRSHAKSCDVTMVCLEERARGPILHVAPLNMATSSSPIKRVAKQNKKVRKEKKKKMIQKLRKM
jgi:hypothetical protein